MGNNGPIITAICTCGNETSIRQYTYNANVKKHGVYTCRNCALKKAGANGSYDRSKNDLSGRAKGLWASKEYKERVADGVSNSWTQEKREKHSQKLRDLWKNDEYRLRMVALAKDVGVKTLSALPRVSSLQKTLYSMLDDLEVKYFREYEDRPHDAECFIGPYPCDCVVPRDEKPWLIIECNGNYQHGRPKQQMRDIQKASFIANNLAHKYELKVLWEHEFNNYNKVIESLKYWLGFTSIAVKQFSFSDVSISDKCPASEYKLLLGKYHYLPNAGRGGKVFGAYYNGELCAVCVFSSLVRQNIAGSLNCNHDEAVELSRLCINPLYQQKNFASWFISKCIKRLPDSIKIVISYADSTFNHNGTVYRACNFVMDHVVRPDYWYVTEDGWIMHKKTLYGQAVGLGLTEAGFSAKYGYEKVFGKEKYRYVYRRKI